MVLAALKGRGNVALLKLTRLSRFLSRIRNALLGCVIQSPPSRTKVEILPFSRHAVIVISSGNGGLHGAAATASSSQEVCQGTCCAPSPAWEPAATLPRGWQADQLLPGFQELEAIWIAFNRLHLPLVSYIWVAVFSFPARFYQHAWNSVDSLFQSVAFSELHLHYNYILLSFGLETWQQPTQFILTDHIRWIRDEDKFPRSFKVKQNFRSHAFL